ncbi:MAG TPA: PAS domain-containing protein [Candidatus Acidoferrum sp.]|nr:PAS domain-containing protein [Candidatus Acidoferrum sp.]
MKRNIMRGMPSSGQGSDRLGQVPDFRLVIDSTPALIHTGLPDGHLDFFNQTWLKYVGRSLDDLQGWKWTESIHPSDVEGIVDRWRASLTTGEPFLYEARVRRADGEYRWMLHHKIAVRDEGGKIVRWYGSSIDIEDQKQAEQALRLTESFLVHAQRLTKAGTWAYKPPDICEYWSAEMFRIFGYDPAKGYPPNDDMIARVHPEDRQRGEQALAQLFEKHREFDQKYRFIRPDGQVRVIQDFGAPVFENGSVTRFVGACLDITEQEQMTKELKRREAYLAEAQRLSHTGSFGWMVSSGEIFWSKETFRIFGFDPSVKPTLDLIFERVHPEDLAVVKRTIARASQDGRNFDLEHRLLLPGASVKNVQVVAQALRNESGDIEFVGAVMDVTEAKRTEERIANSEKELRLTIETIPAHIGTNLPDGSVDFIAQSFLDYVGLSKEQWLNWGWMDVTHPEDVDGAVQGFRAALASGKKFEYEQRIRHADGTYRWFLGRNVPLRNEKGTIVKWYGTLLDIEDRKRAELKLRQDEQEFRRIVDAIPHAIHVLKPDGSFLYANQAVLDYTGFTMDEVMAPDYRRRVFHPEGLENVERERQAALSHGVPFEQERRARRSDGQYRWFLIHFNPLRDEQGLIIRWYATGIDIEDRKRAEERMRNENLALREEIDRSSMFEEIVGASPALQAVLSRVSKVASVDSTVLITGDTGTGKELVARAIHRRSRRSSHPFVSVNCAAIPRDLIASELFGHEKGSFTGALQRRLGRFELAEGGTLFLDEVGELPMETQIILLRVLQEREFQRVGGSQTIRADVRVIAATNRDLEAAISSGTFRRDLFYRLNVFPIEIPSLRERKEDIPVLVEYFIDRFCRKAGKKIRTIEKKTLELLQSYSWPGNIRELQNVIERSVIVCETETFSVDPSWLSVESSRANSAGQPFAKTSAAQAKEKIEAALAQTEGRVSGPSGAAAILGIPASTLETRIRSLKINKFRFKSR